MSLDGRMIGIALVAALAALWAYRFLSARLHRRDTARTVVRLSQRTAPTTAGAKDSRVRLMKAAGDMGGELAARILNRLRLNEITRQLLETAAIKWTPSGLLHRSTAFFVVGFAIATLALGNGSPQIALAAGAALACLPIMYVRRAARRRVTTFEGQFPDCLEFLSRSMRAGHALSMAFEMAYREFSDPVAGEIRRIFEEQNLGQPLDVVLRKLSQRIPSMDVQFFVSAVALQKRTGGNLAELLDKLAQLIRERFKLRARIRAVSAQGLMSGRILSAIPMGVGALMLIVNPQYARFFIDDPAGHELVAIAAGLQVCGYLIIKKIVTFEV